MAQQSEKTSSNTENDENVESEEVLLIDEDNDVEEEAVVKEIPDEEKKFTPGAISASQLDATRLYLNEIGFSPLLTAEEEVYYSRKLLKVTKHLAKK